jgi:hypothetical protein
MPVIKPTLARMTRLRISQARKQNAIAAGRQLTDGGSNTSTIMELAVYPPIYFLWRSRGLSTKSLNHG